MVTILSGVGLLLVTLAVFSIFSLKMPKGSLAMGGMADAAVATFLVEAIHKYISGDLIGIAFLREVGRYLRKHGRCCRSYSCSNCNGF